MNYLYTNSTKGIKEYIISCGILDLFPECYIMFNNARDKVQQADPMLKDVCAECNNQKISYIDKVMLNQLNKGSYTCSHT